MCFDTNISCDFDLEKLERSGFEGFCITKSVELADLKKNLDWKIPKANKKIYRKLELVLPNTNTLPLKTIEKYDVYCIKVKDCEGLEKVIELDPDMIAFDFTVLQKFKVRHLRLAIKRNIYFEIKLVDSLYNKATRLVWMYNVAEFLRIVKYKNVVFSSGAKIWTEIREPEDFLDLIMFFGFTKKKAEKILNNSRSLLESCAMKRFCFKDCIISNINESSLKKDFIIDTVFK
ncbi:Ribonuclease P protein subunit p30 [Nosema granulosis]|uniref:Ribonuclease P protein subunit p30 n=1 Tax=Nosema granulosis TaxID=83296 RepID=A0A9P6GYK1_9MICR|nr:Ribonuclease P protein subunit p30 [Nosema granulosis]